jgi:predicted MFS family arabinose efflux permease
MSPDGSPRAVGGVFALAGVTATAAFARVPSLRDAVDATPAQLSLALVCVGIGSLATMPFTGRLTERLSSAVVIRGAAVLALGGWSLAAFASSVPALAGCMLLFGMGAGVWDVAMNVQGHTVEQRRHRVLMPGWHAAYSYGAVAGAGIGAAFAKAGVPVTVQFPLVSAVAGVLLVWWTRSFIRDDAPAPVAIVEETRRPARARISMTEVLLGVMMLATALGEGAANDWLGLTLVDDRGLPEAFGALTLAGFNLTMAAARVVGGRVIERVGRVPVLRASGATAAGGVLLLCLVDSPVAALIGAACWGLGLAVVFPSGISAAGELPDRGARAISVVSTIGYTGFLLGAPLIGQLTHVVPLDRALLVVAAAGVLIVVVAPVARERPGSAAGSTPAEQG